MTSHHEVEARVLSHQERSKASTFVDLSPLSCGLSGAEFFLDRQEKEDYILLLTYSSIKDLLSADLLCDAILFSADGTGKMAPFLPLRI